MRQINTSAILAITVPRATPVTPSFGSAANVRGQDEGGITKYIDTKTGDKCNRRQHYLSPIKTSEAKGHPHKNLRESHKHK